MAFNLNFKFKSDADQACNSMKRLQKELTNTGNKFTNLTKDSNRTSIGLNKFSSSVGKLASMLSAAYIGRKLADFTQSAMDSIETVNLFSIALGDCAVEADKWVNSLSEASGLDKTNLMNATATYNLLARSMGMAGEQAQILSRNTTQLALDLSSAMNVPFAQAMQDLRSGLVGQSETMYKYGVDVTEAALKQEALNQGISKSVREMSQGEKMALRYCVMIRQTSIAQGDFARTITDPANQLRILSERIVSCGRAIGSIFIPMLEAILPIINTVILGITKLANAIAKLFGYKPKEVFNDNRSGFSGISDGADSATDSIGKTNSALGKTAKALKEVKNASNGLDELNVISPVDNTSNGGSGGGTSGVGGGSVFDDIELPEYDFGLDGENSLDKKVQRVVDKIIRAFDGFKEINLEPLSKSLDRLYSSLQPLSSLSLDVLLFLIQDVLQPLSKIIIEQTLPNTLNFLADSIDSIVGVLRTGFDLIKKLWDVFLLPLSKVILTDGVNLVLTGLSVALDAIVKVLEIGLDLLDMLVDDVLEPIGDIFISKTLPTVLDALAKALDALGSVLNWALDLLVSFVNDFLRPLFDFAKPLIVDYLESLNDGLTDLISTIEQSEVIKELKDTFNEISELLAPFYERNINDIRTIIELIMLIGEIIGKLQLENTLIDIKYAFKNLADAIGFVCDVINLDFDGAWEHLKNLLFQNHIDQTKEKVDKLKDGLSGLVDKIKEVAKEWKKNIQDCFDEWNKKVKEWWDKHVAPWFTKEKWASIFENIGISLALAIENMVYIWNDKILAWWNENVAPWFTVEKWKEVFSTIKTSLVDFFSGNNGYVQTWNNKMNDWWTNNVLVWFTLEKWTELGTKMKDGLLSGFSSFVDGVKGTINGAITGIEKLANGCVWAFNKIISGYNKVAEKSPLLKTITPVKEVNLSAFKLARGGMLSSGDIFEAGENGMAELIGSHKGKTTVMPLENTDFVNAMYKAVRSAMQENNNSNNGTTIVKIGDEVVYRSVEKSKQRNGYKISKNYAGGLV